MMSEVNIHPGDTLPYKVPDGPGLYAWYWAPNIPLQEIKAAAIAEDQGAAQRLYELILRHVVEPYQLPVYDVLISAPLRPHFEGKLRQVQPQLARLQSYLSERGPENGAMRLRTFLRSCFAPNFASPVYVGLAARQSLRTRIQQHLSAIEKHREQPADERAELLRALLSRDSEESEKLAKEGHLFALEVVARGIELRDLLLVTLEFADRPSAAEAPAIEAIEELVNRMIYPSFGRR